jgi:YD repeat-containing protein
MRKERVTDPSSPNGLNIREQWDYDLAGRLVAAKNGFERMILSW